MKLFLLPEPARFSFIAGGLTSIVKGGPMNHDNSWFGYGLSDEL